mmetsp:Transcript_12217/g.29010  ORF Transcript_12217/g.29010 Transcript_12217/m.29010 type:complete len:117 (-) Transcript_12217:314-664(-)
MESPLGASHTEMRACDPSSSFTKNSGPRRKMVRSSRSLSCIDSQTCCLVHLNAESNVDIAYAQSWEYRNPRTRAAIHCIGERKKDRLVFESPHGVDDTSATADWLTIQNGGKEIHS